MGTSNQENKENYNKMEKQFEDLCEYSTCKGCSLFCYYPHCEKFFYYEQGKLAEKEKSNEMINTNTNSDGYCNADDIKDLDIGLMIRQSIANYINSVIRQAQSDAWEEGYRVANKRNSLDKEFEAEILNPYK